jgi:hypothetical protein
MNEALTLAFTMLGGGMTAIILLMLLAKLTGKVNVEEKQGRKPVYNIQAKVKGKRTLVEADPENPTIPKTRYFLTFHKRDGNRVEMEVPGEDYGLAAEGDEGILVYTKGD